MNTINKVIVILFVMVLFEAIFVDLTPTAVFAEEKSSLDTISTYSLNHKIIVYNDVRLLYGSRYAPYRIVDKAESEVFVFDFKGGNIVKTKDNRVVIIDKSCILSFYGVSFEEIVDWYCFPHGGLNKKFIKCEKLVLEIK